MRDDFIFSLFTIRLLLPEIREYQILNRIFSTVKYMNQQLLIEALAVGILLVPLGYLVLYGSVELSKRSKTIDQMDKNVKMSVGFFVLGVLTHIFCEITGINHWYCKKGSACQRIN